MSSLPNGYLCEIHSTRSLLFSSYSCLFVSPRAYLLLRSSRAESGWGVLGPEPAAPRTRATTPQMTSPQKRSISTGPNNPQPEPPIIPGPIIPPPPPCHPEVPPQRRGTPTKRTRATPPIIRAILVLYRKS